MMTSVSLVNTDMIACFLEGPFIVDWIFFLLLIGLEKAALKRLFMLGVFLFKLEFLNYCLGSDKDKSLNKDKMCDLLRKVP